MYQSRYRMGNGHISIAVDSLSGELVELVNMRTGENLIKNAMFPLPQPFRLTVEGGELTPPSTAEGLKDPGKRTQITIERVEGGQVLCCRYPALMDGETTCNVRAEYIVRLPDGETATYWRLKLENQSGRTITKVCFPCLNGVYLGKSWQDNVLVYPYNAGIRIENPVEFLAREEKKIDWRWQEYRYQYWMDSIGHQKLPDGRNVLEEAYSGALSMRWLDLYNKEQGLYFASHDPSWDISSLRVESFGENRPGLNLSTAYPTNIKPDECYISPEHVIALHEEDWHVGAELYRKFKMKQGQYHSGPLPEWFVKSPGLVAHYDFKYQNGGVVHHFSDLPMLYEQAKEMGLNHLLLAGWHQDGFDNGFPMYKTDPELGTEEELAGEVAKIRKDGGHVCCYINSRLVNIKYDCLRDFIDKNAVMRRDGLLAIERYGSREMEFASMSAASPEWQKYIAHAVRYTTETLGMDGVYLDQIAMAPPCECFNPNFKHAFNGWNDGYENMLDRIRKEHIKSPIAMIYEGVSDIHGSSMGGQLISTFFYYHQGAYPELYKYTFPEQILVDMLYPYRFQAMRPVHVGQASTGIINKAFVTGAYYWIYDLEQDNTFRLDPTQYEYLRGCIALRRLWLERFGHGRFVDTKGIFDVPEGVMAKRFELSDGLLIACAREKDSTGGRLRVVLPHDSVVQKAQAFGAKGERAARIKPCSNGLWVEIPPEPLSLLYIAAEHNTVQGRI